MSVYRSPLIVSSLALLAALSLSSDASFARDARQKEMKPAPDITMEPQDSASDDIIFVMPPLKPVKGALAAGRKAAPTVAEKAAPPAEAPATIAPAPAPAPVAQKAETAARAMPKAGKASVARKPAVEPRQAQKEAAKAPEPAPAQANPTIATPEASAPPAAEAAAEPASAPPPVVPPVETATTTPAPEATKATPAETAPAAQEQAAQEPAAQEQAAQAQAPQAEAPQEQAPQEQAAQAQATPAEPEAAKTQPEAQAEASADPAAPPQLSEAEARIAALRAEGVVGPAKIRLADQATLLLPADRVFIPQEPARKLAAEVGLELRAGAQGIVLPARDKIEWLAPVEVLLDGHISASRDQLDGAKLLAAFEASLPQVNAQRAAAGQPAVVLQGWMTPPELDEKQRLSVCVNVSTENDPAGQDRFFNCEAWALGREGAIKVGVADAAGMAESLKGEAQALAGAIVFDHGKAYADFDPAIDRAASYSAADLLIHDVSAKAPAAPAAPAVAPLAENAPQGSILDKLTDPLVLVGGGMVMLLLYIRNKRDKDQKPSSEKRKPAPEKDAKPATDAKLATPAASRSLFARLLPTLHARFARKDVAAPKPAEARKADAPKADAAAPAASARTPARAAPAGESRSLIAKYLPTLHAKFARKGAAAGAARPENDAEEPAQALKKIAALMQGPESAPPASPARAIRPAIRVGGAAVAVAEPDGSETLPASAIPGARTPNSAGDDFGLVEPGDVEAASAAINAARARQEASR